MVKVREDLTGKTFGRLKVIKQAEDCVYPNRQRIAQWECKCSCGCEDLVITSGFSLKSGRTRSCGCVRKEESRKRLMERYPVGKSGVRGVRFIEKTGKYVARIWRDDGYIYVGTYDTVEEAAAARRKAEKKYRGK